MFKSKKTIIYLTKNKLRAGFVTTRPPLKATDLIESDWSLENLGQVLAQVKIKLKAKKIRVLVGEELSYVVSLAIPKTEVKEKDAIKLKLQEVIPENLDESVWDFKETAQTKDKKIVQVVAFVKSFFEVLSAGLNQAGIEAEAIEPTSLALARLTETEKQPHLIIHKSLEALALVADHGLVVASETFDSQVNLPKIGQLLDFVSRHFNITPAKVILSGDMEGFDTKQLEAKDRQIEQKNLDPMIGLALKQDLKGKDEEVLNLKVLNIASTPKPNQNDSESKIEKEIVEEEIKNKEEFPKNNRQPQVFLSDTQKPPLVNKKLLIIFLVILLLSGLTLGGIFTYRSLTKPEAKPEATPTPVVEATPTPEISPSSTPEVKINLADYSVQILNGSGVAGEAGAVQEILTAEGFESIDTGNADSYDYSDTEVQVKKDTPEVVFETIERALNSEYTVLKSDKILAEDSGYDILVIVGVKK